MFSFLYVNGNLYVFLEVISGVIKSMYVSNISKSPSYTHLSSYLNKWSVRLPNEVSRVRVPPGLYMLLLLFF